MGPEFYIFGSGLIYLAAGYPEGAGIGGGVSAGVHYWFMSMALEARGSSQGTVVADKLVDPSRPATPGRELSIGQLSFPIVGCLHFLDHFAGCGVASPDIIYIDIPEETSWTETSWAVGPRLRIEYTLDRMAKVYAFGEALFPVIRKGIAYRSVRTAEVSNAQWVEPVVFGHIGFGFEADFRL